MKIDCNLVALLVELSANRSHLAPGVEREWRFSPAFRIDHMDEIYQRPGGVQRSRPRDILRAQQFDPAFFDHPANFLFWKSSSQSGNRGERVNDVSHCA